MRSLLTAFLLAFTASLSRAADIPQAVAEMRLRKAAEILVSVERVTSVSIGYAGDLPEANWALSVIVSYDPDPAGRLLDIADRSTAEGAIMCMAGVKAVDPAAFAARFAEWRESAAEWREAIEMQNGCIITVVSPSDALQAISTWTASDIICVNIPFLEQTVRPMKDRASRGGATAQVVTVEGPEIHLDAKDGRGEPGATDNPDDAQRLREDN